MTTHHSCSIQFFTALLLASSLSISASANAAPLLEALFPFSCEPGQKVTVSLLGKQLENATALIFSIPDVTASLDDKGKFVVSVASGTPPQDCDVWCIVDGEVSNPRRFVISSVANVAEAGKNDSFASAQTIPFPGAVDGRLEAAAKFDWFQFEAKEEQSVTLSCRSQSLDGSAQPVVTLFGPGGQEIAHSTGRRREPLLHYKFNSSGTYRVRVSDRTYRSAPDSFYRLELLADTPTVAAWPDLLQHKTSSKHKLSFYRHTVSHDEKSSFRMAHSPTFMKKLSVETAFPTAELLPACQSTIEAFDTFVPPHPHPTENAIPGSPRIRFTSHQVGYEKEDTTESATNSQPLDVPSLINGRFNSLNDADWYSFEAKKGESFAIDVYGDRLGHLMDIDAVIMDATGKSLVTFPDMSVVKNLPPVVTPVSLDVSATWKAPANGTFHLVIRDLYGSTLYGVDRTYALSLRPLQPSYEFVITPPDDKTPMGYSIPQGGRSGLRVSLLRRGGFAEAVRLNLSKANENTGLTLDETWIGPGQSSVVAILTDDPENDVVSPARFLELEATTESAPSQIKHARSITLLRTGATEGRFMHRLPVSISQELPLNVDLSIVKPEIQPGEKLALSLTHKLNTGKLKADGKIEFPILPTGMKAPSVELKGDAKTSIEIPIPDKLPPGRYSLAAIVKATVASEPVEAKTKSAPNEQTLKVWSNSVSFRVTPKAKPDSAAPGK